ncbi:MAG: 2-dehydro-3-deoxyphosphogluconate aldolase [Chloroflexi bacterium GWB2_49_20]|nr:MAG: 2-dehydro-3-deoxyphosphogluconate aldolase [Chloroflexi bacterium GWB2_49_20]OGN79717.1 MAG: 2-dehydro-3-deoxyphosphogluconate aldolase [Chloroflexi bacterium GWC2_49_37]OGN85965.1 MAG: 2-dehydro-3-deoxyphosphogluconate aldolase [Chloroflexi bacterium GWD2_49_16]HBG73974.1 2-dehydro-3-deoxyphosphogluconate aldolase [Anaerolineae bacterium]HCC78760.1 2-dehydro-3-deoxyphosphogluconate aldolase [Anaerolineae bacterium]
MDILEITGRYGLLSAIEIQKSQDAVPLGRALLDAGLSVAEITFRTAAAADAIRVMAKSYPQMTIGAGSIVFVSQAEEAVAAGASFIVSAGFNPDLVDWCIGNGIPTLPGVATASEITMGMVRGLKVLKFFPAEVMGGISGLKALSAPFPAMKFIPMGGVSAANMADYLRLPYIHAIGGSWTVNKKLIAEGNFVEITRLTLEALSIFQAVRGIS